MLNLSLLPYNLCVLSVKSLGILTYLDVSKYPSVKQSANRGQGFHSSSPRIYFRTDSQKYELNWVEFTLFSEKEATDNSDKSQKRLLKDTNDFTSRSFTKVLEVGKPDFSEVGSKY